MAKSRITADKAWRDTLRQISTQVDDEDGLSFDSSNFENNDIDEVGDGPVTLREALLAHQVLGKSFNSPVNDYVISFSKDGDVEILKNDKKILTISGDAIESGSNLDDENNYK